MQHLRLPTGNKYKHADRQLPLNQSDILAESVQNHATIGSGKIRRRGSNQKLGDVEVI
jgi:hypothetical protein